jgi:hypothetical protein
MNNTLIFQNYWINRRSVQDSEANSVRQQSFHQHDIPQSSSKAGVVITSFRKSHRRFDDHFIFYFKIYYKYLIKNICNKRHYKYYIFKLSFFSKLRTIYLYEKLII